MTALSKEDLLERIATAVIACGWNFIYISDQHPFRLEVFDGNERHRVIIYIWNITHGGKTRAKDEYRVQVTGLKQFRDEPGVLTLILGWWDRAEVFAGFDVRRHDGQLGASPSLQIREEVLWTAKSQGFAAGLRGNNEVAIAFRSDFFITYVCNLMRLHTFGDSPQILTMLNKVSQDDDLVIEDAVQSIGEPRRREVVTVSRAIRSTSFRTRVLNAYGNQCAMCEIQLELVDAAHIVPVSHPGSTDETSNGIALCSLHHRGFDQGLVMVDEVYAIHVNTSRVSYLSRMRLDQGLGAFQSNLRNTILIPMDAPNRPDPSFIRLGNTLRGCS